MGDQPPSGSQPGASIWDINEAEQARQRPATIYQWAFPPCYNAHQGGGEIWGLPVPPGILTEVSGHLIVCEGREEEEGD